MLANRPTAHTSLEDTAATANKSLLDSESPKFGLGTRDHAVPFQWKIRDLLPTKSIESAWPTAHTSLGPTPSTPSSTFLRLERPVIGTRPNVAAAEVDHSEQAAVVSR